MEAVLLINTDDILFYTNASPNIDSYKVNPHILNAQLMYLEGILGSDLYDKLLDLVDTNEIEDVANVNYKTLLTDYIAPYLVMRTMELYVPLNAFQIADGGAYQHSATNAITSRLEEIDKISKKYQIIGQGHESRLTKYLCKYSDLFVEYTSNDGLVKKTPSTMRASGWNLNKSNVKYPFKT